MGDRVFTGDTLLIRGTGRTDFQNGDRGRSTSAVRQAAQAGRRHAGLPAHDYKGDTVSSIGEENAATLASRCARSTSTSR